MYVVIKSHRKRKKKLSFKTFIHQSFKLLFIHKKRVHSTKEAAILQHHASTVAQNLDLRRVL